MSTCYKCGTELIKNNWASSFMKRNQKICKKCYNTIFNKKWSPIYSPKNNLSRMYVNGKYVPKSHPLHKPGRYKTFNDAAFDGTYKLDNIKEGYVYIISNPAWLGWVKIGMAIDAEDRCNGYQTSSPHRDYELKYTIETEDRRTLEQAAHKEASKLASDTKGEWFKLDVETAIEILNNLRGQDEPRKRSA